MKKTLAKFLLSIVLLLGLAIVARAEDVPTEIFAIGEIRIGEATFDEIQNIYGKTIPYRTSKNDGADSYICYASRNGNVKRYLVFETGAMGGFKHVTGFRLTTKRQRNCAMLQWNTLPQKTGNGVFIGEEHGDFITKFNFNFEVLNKSTLKYENVSQREATPEELERLRKVWPNEKETRFDVTVTIKAQFKNRRFIDYYVSKIESY